MTEEDSAMKRWIIGLVVVAFALTFAHVTSAQTTTAGDTLTVIYVSTSN